MTTNETTTFIPRTIRALIAECEAIGGEVHMTAPRRFEFHLPCRVVGGSIRLVNRAAVGYFVSDGKNRIKGVRGVRDEIAYWGKQAGNR